ncbi:MAG: hypothetical protein WDZ75_00500, partial [Candidatus Paceibacterota bacterium]
PDSFLIGGKNIVDNFELLYRLSMKLDRETYEVFLLVITREKKKKENRVDVLLEWRTETQLARAFDENYIRCGYVPQFVVDCCRIMLKRQMESVKTSTCRAHGSVIAPIGIPHNLSLVVRGNRFVEPFIPGSTKGFPAHTKTTG